MISLCKNCHRSKPRREMKEEINKYFNEQIELNTFTTTNVDEFYNSESDKRSSAFSFKIDESKVLYSNEYEKAYYGRIYRYKTRFTITAKKPRRQSKLNTDTALTSMYRLMQEMKMLSLIGAHENVVRLMGSCTKGLKDGRVYVFLEMCSLGSLETFLSYLRPSKNQAVVNTEILKDLRNWATDISKGMEFVASINVVHAELRTRNILLDLYKTAKIANFGFSRKIQNQDEIVDKKLRPNNWQWMAPESLTRWEFSEKTDVWAFGVTLWELYTLGDTPYAKLSWPSNFATQLERGFRLEKAKYDQHEMYSLMPKCWNTKPENRPDFSTLKEILLSKHTHTNTNTIG